MQNQLTKLLLAISEVRGEADEFVLELPGKLNDLVDPALSNGIRDKVDALDETRLIGGLRKIADCALPEGGADGEAEAACLRRPR